MLIGGMIQWHYSINGPSCSIRDLVVRVGRKM